MLYKIVYTRQAAKDVEAIKRAGLTAKVQKLLAILRKNPYQSPPPFEKLAGDLNGLFSRRINIQHRLVYQVFENEQTIKIIRLWTHYE